MDTLPESKDVGGLIDFLYDRCLTVQLQTELLDFISQAVHTDAELRMKRPPEKTMVINALACKNLNTTTLKLDEGYQLVVRSFDIEAEGLNLARHARFLPVEGRMIVRLAPVQFLDS